MAALEQRMWQTVVISVKIVVSRTAKGETPVCMDGRIGGVVRT